MGCGMCIIEDPAWQEAERKAESIDMSVKGNPLRKAFGPMDKPHIEANMDRLRKDARMWNDQRSGEAYRAIRGMTYGGEE